MVQLLASNKHLPLTFSSYSAHWKRSAKHMHVHMCVYVHVRALYSRSAVEEGCMAVHVHILTCGQTLDGIHLSFNHFPEHCNLSPCMSWQMLTLAEGCS